jgi:hypothetical protein
MGSVMAIVSKAMFEAAGGAKLAPGQLFAVDRYTSAHQALSPLASGGDLVLVTARPGDALWLVAVLRAPQHDGVAWRAEANTTPIRDLSAALPRLRFATGKGIQAKPGALGMSLQTPRLLTDDDLALLDLAAPTAPPPASPPPVSPAAPHGDDAALDALLAAWRADPQPEHIPAAQALSAQLESAAARALREGEQAVDDHAWNKVSSAGAPADVDALCATFHRTTLPGLIQRAAALAELPPDPRVAHLLHRLLRAPPFRATSSQPVWNQLFETVLRHPDPATLAVVRAVAAQAFPAGAAFQKYMATKLANVEKKLVAAGVREAAIAADEAPRAPVAAEPSRRDEAEPGWPTLDAATAMATFANTTPRVLRRAPGGRWAAAWVADPSERERSHEGCRTAALVGFDAVSGAIVAQHPLSDGGQHVFALGHTPGRVARAVGHRVEVIDANGAVASFDLAVGDEPATSVVGLAFTPGDAELVIGLCVVLQRGERRDVMEERAVLLTLADGSTRGLWAHEAYDDRSEWRSELLWATDDAVVWVTLRTTRVWDRRWGALAQVIEYPWSAPISDGRTAALPHRSAVGFTTIDLATGDASRSDDERVLVDVHGDRILTSQLSTRRQAPAGPLVVIDRAGRELARVERPADDDASAILLADGLLRVDGDGLRVEPSGVAPRWWSPRADRLATAPGVRATATGSRAHVETAQGTRRHDEDHPIRALALSPDGATLYVGATKSVRAVPLGKGKAKTWAGHAYPVTALGVSPQGVVVSASEDHLVIVWEPSGTARHRFTDAPGPVVGVAIDPSGQRVACAGDDGLVRVYDLASGQLLRAIPAPGCAGPLAWSASGATLAVMTPDGLSLHDAHGATLTPLPGALALAAHPARALFVVATADGRLHGVSPTGAAAVLAQGYQPAPTALAFHADGSLSVGAGAGATVSTLPLTWEA